jgi:hypothetical protein
MDCPLQPGDLIAGFDAGNHAQRAGVVVEPGEPDGWQWRVVIEAPDRRKGGTTRRYTVLWPVSK